MAQIVSTNLPLQHSAGGATDFLTDTGVGMAALAVGGSVVAASTAVAAFSAPIPVIAGVVGAGSLGYMAYRDSQGESVFIWDESPKKEDSSKTEESAVSA